MKSLAIAPAISRKGLKEISTVNPIQVLQADALSGLKSVASASAQVCLTSPPFYLLRRYGTATTWPDGWEGELGHEPHPNDFTRHLLHVFDEVWRTLRDDGCLWVNLADTFNNKQGKKGTTNAPDGCNGRFAAGGKGYADALRQQPEFFKHYVPGIAHKSEMGVPFRFHLAMTDKDFRRFVGASEGPQWICRRTIIWAKSLVALESQKAEGNAMPEPTRDRPSRNYEFLFLFSKKPNYYFDRTAIDVPARASARRSPGSSSCATSRSNTPARTGPSSRTSPCGSSRCTRESRGASTRIRISSQTHSPGRGSS